VRCRWFLPPPALSVGWPAAPGAPRRGAAWRRQSARPLAPWQSLRGTATWGRSGWGWRSDGAALLVSPPPRTVGGLVRGGDGGDEPGGSLAPPAGSAVGALAVAEGDGGYEPGGTLAPLVGLAVGDGAVALRASLPAPSAGSPAAPGPTRRAAAGRRRSARPLTPWLWPTGTATRGRSGWVRRVDGAALLVAPPPRNVGGLACRGDGGDEAGDRLAPSVASAVGTVAVAEGGGGYEPGGTLAPLVGLAVGDGAVALRASLPAPSAGSPAAPGPTRRAAAGRRRSTRPLTPWLWRTGTATRERTGWGWRGDGVSLLVSPPPRTVGGLACRGDGGDEAGDSLAPPVGAAVDAVAVAEGDSAAEEEWVGVGWRRRCVDYVIQKQTRRTLSIPHWRRREQWVGRDQSDDWGES